MHISNDDIAAALDKVADELEKEFANPFRIRAYRKAARSVRKHETSLKTLVTDEYDLTKLYGIGKAMAAHIKTIIATGKPPEFAKQKPTLLAELKHVKGLGPKRLRILRDELNITTKEALQKAIALRQLRDLPGFSEKLEEQLKENLRQHKSFKRKLKIYYAIPIIESLLEHLRVLKGIKKVECAGSYRRRKEVVNDFDIIITVKKQNNIINEFLDFYEVGDILEISDTYVSVILRAGIKVSLHIVQDQEYGGALLHYTGSTEHLIELEKYAVQQELELKREGLFKHNKIIASANEEEIYGALKLEYIAPELRENRGEIIAAANNNLPKLIELSDIKGDLHSHTFETDGTETIEVMTEEAIKRGYEYFAITDHTKRLVIANGLNEERLLAQIKLIDKLNEKFAGRITILKSTEVDILEDGSLDMPDWVLKELDLTVCSVHSKFKLDAQTQTERIIRAMDNPHFTILGHATGRLIGSREPYKLDIERVIQAAKERGCFLELNSQPARLDINDLYCKMAKEIGVKLAISTDAHTTRGIGFMHLGINQARRGWIEAKDVINTRSLVEFRKLVSRK